MKRLLPVLAVLALCLGVMPAGAGNQDIRKFLLFNGTNAADSSERASPWIPIRGATRVYMRVWSAGAVADTDFCDTVTTWKTLLSDSVLFIARDSLGTTVTASNRIPFVSGSHGEPFPMCADSVVISNAAADSVKMVMAINPVQGVAKPVRGSGTGSGYWVMILPAPVAGVVSTTLGATGPSFQDVFMPGYMRIRITPRTRLTTAGFSSTAGIRTRGLNKLKIEAYVMYQNK